MKEKIIAKASDLFLKLGFKSITMDDIASEMCISKKTIYKFFANKEVLIEETTAAVHEQVYESIHKITLLNLNAIEENFVIKKMFKELFNSAEASPIFQLRKHYPEIYEKVMAREIKECNLMFIQNIKKGVEQGFYRENINFVTVAKFYYTLIFNIYDTDVSEEEAKTIEYEALEYHIRAIATPAGITELENQLEKFNHQSI